MQNLNIVNRLLGYIYLQPYLGSMPIYTFNLAVGFVSTRANQL